MTACKHCGEPVTGQTGADAGFCCPGCQTAYDLIQGMGLDNYYQRKIINPDTRPLKPDDDAPRLDYDSFVVADDDGHASLHLMVEGLHCAACVWLIETVLARSPGVVSARVNMTTKRLKLVWQKDRSTASALAALVNGLGYRLVPYDAQLIDDLETRREKELLRAMAVAGFAAGNVMLLSISIWAGFDQDMDPATRGLLYWVSALIALPAVAYAGVPFFRSALQALSNRHVNMDVPISLAVILASAMSLYETITGGDHAYFDSAITLLFFLLVGRYLDKRARGRARSAAEHLLALQARAVTVIRLDGRHDLVAPNLIEPGMRVLVAAGEGVGVDGVIVQGTSDLDGQVLTGESLPVSVKAGDDVFAGQVNLTSPLVITVTKAGEQTLLSEIVRLMEKAEENKSSFVTIADRVAGFYAPVVHGLGLAAFLGWWLLGGLVWQEALLIAISVLIITCPCALALAVPVVQVVASSRLMRAGVLVKSGTALERLAEIDTVVFDKTGTLTKGMSELVEKPDDETLALAASMAANSRHPLAKALVRAAGSAVIPAEGVKEYPGCGLEMDHKDGLVWLGSRSWLGLPDDDTRTGSEIWLKRPGKQAVRFGFDDVLRDDARDVVARLKAKGCTLHLLSGDRKANVEAMAEVLGIDHVQAEISPAGKCSALEEMERQGRKTLMVGDGLNDAPALAAASVSMSPSSAADVSQTAADIVFQGVRLKPVWETIRLAGAAKILIRQNFALAFLYNAITIPLSVAGQVTPLIAAIAMSTSSVIVIVNALRLNRT